MIIKDVDLGQQVVKKVPLSEPGNLSSEHCGLCDVNPCAMMHCTIQHSRLSSLSSFPTFSFSLFGGLETLPSYSENNLGTLCGIVHERPKTCVNESADFEANIKYFPISKTVYLNVRNGN